MQEEKVLAIAAPVVAQQEPAMESSRESAPLEWKLVAPDWHASLPPPQLLQVLDWPLGEQLPEHPSDAQPLQPVKLPQDVPPRKRRYCSVPLRMPPPAPVKLVELVLSGPADDAPW